MFVVFDLGGCMVCCVNEIWKYFACVVFCGCEIGPARRRLSGLGALCGWAELVYADVRCL